MKRQGQRSEIRDRRSEIRLRSQKQKSETEVRNRSQGQKTPNVELPQCNALTRLRKRSSVLRGLESVFIIRPMAMRPVGTVTFLFTDMEGSTRAWEAHPKETHVALQCHDEIVTKAIEANRGTIILERGEGDSIFAVFERASDAVAAACDLQLALGKEEWPSEVPLHVRVGIHTGEADADYRGAHV